MGPPQPRHAGHCATLDGSNRGHFSGPGNPAGETDCIHRVGASHKIDVAEDKINDRSRGEDGNSFRRISCFDDIVASYPQRLGSDTAHKDFVLDNQDDVVPVFPPRCCLWAHVSWTPKTRQLVEVEPCP